MSENLTTRIPLSKIINVLESILLKYGFEQPKASACAKIFASNSIDGVYSHGINRFPRFIEYIQKEYIDIHAEPTKVAGDLALEQWDGQLGPGPLNATKMTERAIKLADQFGLGCIALRNTNHWMRGGTYGWQAAKKGYAFMGWTNTIANMPAWGAIDCKLGNNPLVMAMPFLNDAIVLDMAMSQFSYGKMENLSLLNQELPLPGGFNKNNELTQNPKEILETERPLPMGYWKGAGLSLMLDLLGTILSAGLSTSEITTQNKSEFGVSQVFIAFNLTKLNNFPSIEKHLMQIIADFKQSTPENENNTLRYPGERSLKTRTENLEKGVPVDNSIWKIIQTL